MHKIIFRVYYYLAGFIGLGCNTINSNDNMYVENEFPQDYDERRKQYREDLDKILKSESETPEYFANEIREKLPERYKLFFGLQSSTNSSRKNYRLESYCDIYLRSLLLEQSLSPLYCREENTKRWLLADFQTGQREILNNKTRTVKSDKIKKIFLKANGIGSKQNYFDMFSSCFEIVRTVLSIEEEFSAVAFSMKDIFDRNYLNFIEAKKLHLLQNIVLNDLKELIKIDEKIIKDELTSIVLKNIWQVFSLISSIDIENDMKISENLEEMQYKYDTLTSLYEAYLHLTHILIDYNTDKGSNIYTNKQYKDIFGEILRTRYTNSKLLSYVQDNIITKGGMDAIFKAILAVGEDTESGFPINILKICKDGDCISPDTEDAYFEISQMHRLFSGKNEHLCKKEILFKHPIFVSGLSCARYSPQGKYDEESIVEKVLQEKKCVLILDNTVELSNRDEDPVYKILCDDRILKKLKDGNLIICLAKSLQKFATLGTQKVRAGNLTIIAEKSSEFLKNFHEKVKKFDDLYENKYWTAEMQWMTHLLYGNSHSELQYLETCNRNTKLFFTTLEDVFTKSKNKLKEAESKLNHFIGLDCETKDNSIVEINRLTRIVEPLSYDITKVEKLSKTLLPSFSLAIARNFKQGGAEIELITNFASCLASGFESFGYSFTCISNYPGGYRLNFGLEPGEIFIPMLIEEVLNSSRSGHWKIKK